MDEGSALQETESHACRGSVPVAAISLSHVIIYIASHPDIIAYSYTGWPKSSPFRPVTFRPV